MNENLKTSQNGLEFITKWEGCILKPYKDVAGLRTIGVGHLIKSGENYPDGVEITKEHALELLSKDVEHCERSIQKNIEVPLNQNQFDALVSFGFNCGTGVYSNSGVASSLRIADYSSVPSKLEPWSKARINGTMQTVKGLLNRRKDEGILFTTPDPENDVLDFPVNVSKDLLLDIQDRLKKLGLYAIKVDGLWGPGTKSAVEKFSESCGVSHDDPSKELMFSFLTELRKQT